MPAASRSRARSSATSRSCSSRPAGIWRPAADRRSPRVAARGALALPARSKYDGAVATSSELGQAFAAAWSASPPERGGAVSDELASLLVQLCAAAHRELPELEGAID